MLDRALDAFAAVKTAFEAEHGALPGGARRSTQNRRPRVISQGLEMMRFLRGFASGFTVDRNPGR